MLTMSQKDVELSTDVLSTYSNDTRQQVPDHVLSLALCECFPCNKNRARGMQDSPETYLQRCGGSPLDLVLLVLEFRLMIKPKR